MHDKAMSDESGQDDTQKTKRKFTNNKYPSHTI
jgi:hypothetical protein